jgi:DNA repair protein RadC
VQPPKKSIKDWAPDDRPREKLLAKGSEALSNSELLAILLGSGTKTKSAIEVGKEVLGLAGDNLNMLGKLTLKELMKVDGIGEARAITIAAALELGRRRQANEWQKTVVKSSKDIALYLQAQLRDKTHEVFIVAFLNKSGKVIHLETISEGGIDATIVDTRIILKKALEQNAVNIVLCHNHPSGSLKPSKADEHLTQKIKQAALLLDIGVLDHVIVSENGYYSFADDGLL